MTKADRDLPDRRGRLERDPFVHRSVSDGSIRISRGGRVVTVVRGEAARRLGARLAGADPGAVQLELARATGQYRPRHQRD